MPAPGYIVTSFRKGGMIQGKDEQAQGQKSFVVHADRPPKATD